MRAYLYYFCVFAALLGLFAGCATNDAAKDESAKLQAQIIELQKSIADTNLRLEEMHNSIFILQEQTKANKAAISKVSQPNIYIQDSPSAENFLEPPPAVPIPQGGTNTSGGFGAVTVNSAGSDEFDSALSSYQKNNYGLAVFDFCSYLSKNGNSAKAEHALYYLGMSYFRLNEFAQAIREWNKLLSMYPAGQRTAEVSYRIGVAYNTLGDREKAGNYFDLVLRKYPNSEWSKKAATAIKQ